MTATATATATPKPQPQLDIKLKLHGNAYTIRADADAVMASEWSVANRFNIRHGDNTTSDAAAVERDANIGDARRAVNAAAVAIMQRKPDPAMNRWEGLAVRNKAVASLLRKVR